MADATKQFTQVTSLIILRIRPVI